MTDVSAEVRRFLQGDLSKLKTRYDERFTRRATYDGHSILNYQPDELDDQIRAWFTARNLPDTYAHVIRSQPYPNAQRVFHDLTEMVGQWEGAKRQRHSLASYAATYDLDWLIALFAIGDMFDPKLSYRWIFESLRLFWPLDLVAQWLHTLFPEDFFALSTDLFWRADRFRRFCHGLGIEVEWPAIDEHPVSAYLNVDEAIRAWADDQDIEPWELWAVFEHLAPRLFPDPTDALPDARQVWVATASDESFAGLDNPNESTQAWTANAEIGRGDIVLMYCMAPRKAFTHCFRALCDAYENPFDDSWTADRVWTELGERESIPWIRLDEMRADPVLSRWGVVRSNFQGARRSAVPAPMWRRIQEMIRRKRQDPRWADCVAEATRQATGKQRVSVQNRVFTEQERDREREFEDRVVIPLLVKVGIDASGRVMRQVPIRMYVGSRRVTSRADIVVYSDDGQQEPVMVIEAKRSIQSDDDLDAARQQAESYAGYLRATRFMVIAPEGIWVYGMQFPGQSGLLARVGSPGKLSERETVKLRGLFQ